MLHEGTRGVFPRDFLIVPMPSPKYPLKPLLEQRERNVDGATAELGSAIRAREAADAARVRAERQRQDEEERANRVRCEEAERLARGELRAADLAHAQAWELAARAQLAQLDRAVDAAEQSVERARGDETAARTQLAQKMADRDVVVKDKARFDDRLKKRALVGEEEAAEEAYRGGRS